ncbi:MAG: hypothetical protein K1X64_13120 [Myxococcaceae bacterium]|nr:hypothetical protein [Myxococcaceae bacterium]
MKIFKRWLWVGAGVVGVGCGSPVEEASLSITDLPAGECMPVQTPADDASRLFAPIGTAGHPFHLDLFAPRGVCVPHSAAVTAQVQGPDQAMMPVDVSSELMVSSGAYRIGVDFTPPAAGRFKAMAQVEPQVAQMEREVWVARPLPGLTAPVSLSQPCTKAQLTNSGLLVCTQDGRVTLWRDGQPLASLPGFQARVAGNVIWVHHGATVSRWVDYGEGAPAKFPAAEWEAQTPSLGSVLLASEAGLVQLYVRETVDGASGVGELTRYALSEGRPVTFNTQLVQNVTGVVAAAVEEGNAAFVGWNTGNASGLVCRMPFDMSEVPTCQAVQGELVGADTFGVWTRTGGELQRVGVGNAGWAVQATMALPLGWGPAQVEGASLLALSRLDSRPGQVIVSSRVDGAELASVGDDARVLGANAFSVLAADAALRTVRVHTR